MKSFKKKFLTLYPLISAFLLTIGSDTESVIKLEIILNLETSHRLSCLITGLDTETLTSLDAELGTFVCCEPQCCNLSATALTTMRPLNCAHSQFFTFSILHENQLAGCIALEILQGTSKFCLTRSD